MNAPFQFAPADNRHPSPFCHRFMWEKSGIQRKLRQKLFQKTYAKQGKRGDPCVYCGFASYVLDHVPALTHVRESDPSNRGLFPACRACNTVLGSLPENCMVRRGEYCAADPEKTLERYGRYSRRDPAYLLNLEWRCRSLREHGRKHDWREVCLCDQCNERGIA